MMTREMSGWMSVSDEAGSPLVLFHKALQVYRVNWLRAKAQMDRWQEEVTLVQNETRWMHLWLVYHRNIWEGRATKSEQEGLKGLSQFIPHAKSHPIVYTLTTLDDLTDL